MNKPKNPNRTMWPERRDYPHGNQTTDGRPIGTCYACFYGLKTGKAAQIGFYFFRLTNEPLNSTWHWQAFDLSTLRHTAIHGGFSRRSMAVAAARKAYDNVITELSNTSKETS